MQRHDQINRSARFLPQTNDDEVPAISVGCALVAVYWTAEHQLRVSIGTRDGNTGHYVGNHEGDHNPPMQVTLHEATIYQNPAAPAPGAVARLDDRELFAQLALSEYAELHGGAGLDYPVDALAAEIERRIPGSLDRVAAHLDRSTPAEVVREWMTQPDTLLAIARAEPTPAERTPRAALHHLHRLLPPGGPPAAAPGPSRHLRDPRWTGIGPGSRPQRDRHPARLLPTRPRRAVTAMSPDHCWC